MMDTPKWNELDDRDLIGQVLCYDIRDTDDPAEVEKVICHIRPGALYLDKMSREKIRMYTDMANRYTKIPTIIVADVEFGPGENMPDLPIITNVMSWGACDDPALIEQAAELSAKICRLHGIHWTLSPVVDLNINFNNPLVNIRSASDDPKQMVKIMGAFLRGIQRNGYMAATLKHFPGDGMDYRDQHITTTYNDCELDDWRATYGKVFSEMINAGVDSVMAGHIGLPAYTKEISERFKMPLPATLSKELITDLLKGEMGFDGIVVTDALGMGGFAGWYPTNTQAEIESFKAGCDMMLWPTKEYADALEAAILSGDVPMSRLDDAVTRILRVKEKRGLFDPDRKLFREISEEEVSFIKSFQKRCSEKGITLVRNRLDHFPLDVNKTKKIGIVVISEYKPALEEAKALKTEFEARGFEVDYNETGKISEQEAKRIFDENDIVIYATFSRPFRPVGFIDYTAERAMRLRTSYSQPNYVDKLAVVSFGSPYFGDQYFEKAQTYVNAYSMLECSVKAFVRAACGEIDFEGVSPVKLNVYDK